MEDGGTQRHSSCHYQWHCTLAESWRCENVVLYVSISLLSLIISILVFTFEYYIMLVVPGFWSRILEPASYMMGP